MALLSRPSGAQEPPDLARLTNETREQLQRLSDGVRQRRLELLRDAELLVSLAEGGDSIVTLAVSPLGGAGARLDAAERVQPSAVPLDEPARLALKLLRDLVDHPGVGSVEQLRVRYFAILRPLEEDLLRQINSVEQQAREIHRLAGGMLAAEGELDNATLIALHDSIEVRGLASK